MSKAEQTAVEPEVASATPDSGEERLTELEAQIAELKELLAAQASAPAPQVIASGRRAFTVNGPRPKAQAKAEVEAAHSKKVKTYIAVQNGTDFKQGFIPVGTVFSTTQPQGSWMEAVDD